MEVMGGVWGEGVGRGGKGGVEGVVGGWCGCGLVASVMWFALVGVKST